MRTVTLLHAADCPNWQTTADHLSTLASELDLTVETRVVATPEEADANQFRGSPTVLVDGSDPFAVRSSPVSLSCRLYATPDGLRGSPTLDMLRQALGGSPDRRG